MGKIKTAFFCQNCGSQSPKWMGKCSGCGEWNTYVEEVLQKETAAHEIANKTVRKTNTPQQIEQIEASVQQRILLKDEELNRVLGGGIVPGSIVLFGGEPGIGKSTLMLQMALQNTTQKVMYVSGEESELQIKMRAERIGYKNANCYVLTETSTQNIFLQAESIQPDILIIDSIQTLHTAFIDSSPGSISQIRECASEMLRYAKETGKPVFLIGHITKDGALAGPKVLEHMVDAVLQFEGDRNHVYRLLRSVKNRFGSTNELGVYEMVGTGLREVANPSEVLLSSQENLSGVSIAATLEGMRPMLIETQALVSSAAYGTPQRSATGFDLRRMNMLLAVLEKRCGFRLSTKDVFLNIAGGIKVEDPAIDLAVMASILSSSEDIPLVKNICFSAEIGLTGEIRPVTRVDQRIAEAEKLGLEKIVISKYNKGIETKNYKIEVIKVGKIEDAFKILFG
jgi:DNA repair protein RadA/Sms